MKLILAPLLELWRQPGEKLFAGPYALPEDLVQRSEFSGAPVLPFLWDHPDKIEKALKRCWEIHETLLVALTERLNEIHGVRRPLEFYRLLFSSWLLHFVHSSYDKLQVLRQAREVRPSLVPLLLEAAQYRIPLLPGVLGYKDPAMLLQHFSALARELGWQSTAVSLEHPPSMTDRLELGKKGSLTYRLARRVSLLLNRLRGKPGITLTATYFFYDNIKNTLSLLLKGRGLFVLDEMNYPLQLELPVDPDLRKRLRLDLTQDEEARVLGRILPAFFPRLYLEGFAQVEAAIQAMPIRRTAAYYSAQGLHAHPVFCWVTALRHKESWLLYHQHGAGYGIDREHALEDLEMACSHRYFTWGWSRPPKASPLPHPKLAGLASKRARRRRTLVVLNSYPTFLYRFHYQPSDHGVESFFLRPACRFLTVVGGDRLEVNTHERVQEGWQVRQRLIRDVPFALEFDDAPDTFMDKMERFDLFVFFNQGTVFLERMAANLPALLYLDSGYFRPSAHSAPYLEALQAVGIYHDSLESLIEQYQRIQDDPLAWWNGEAVQKAAKSFARHYALSEANWVDQWVGCFEGILVQPPPEAMTQPGDLHL